MEFIYFGRIRSKRKSVSAFKRFARPTPYAIPFTLEELGLAGLDREQRKLQVELFLKKVQRSKGAKIELFSAEFRITN